MLPEKIHLKFHFTGRSLISMSCFSVSFQVIFWLKFSYDLETKCKPRQLWGGESNLLRQNTRKEPEILTFRFLDTNTKNTHNIFFVLCPQCRPGALTSGSPLIVVIFNSLRMRKCILKHHWRKSSSQKMRKCKKTVEKQKSQKNGKRQGETF